MQKEVNILDIARLLPKTELHLHLDGSLSEDFILRKSKEHGIDVPFESLGGVRKYLHDMKAAHRKQSLAQGKLNNAAKNQNWPHFDFMNQFLQTKDDLSEATEDLCRHLQRQGVWLAEIRFCPTLHTLKGLTEDEIVAAVVQGFERGKVTSANGSPSTRAFIGGIIICALRSYEASHFTAMIELTKRWLGRGVVGFDIAGDEGSYPVQMHLESLHHAIALGIPVTCHAGEWPNSLENIRLCVKEGVKRLGHGITLIDDKELTDEVVRKKIGVECCITGNVGGLIVKTYESHPIRQLYLAGVAVTINSDNQMLSGSEERNATTLNDLVYLRQSLGFEWNEIKQVLMNGVLLSFTEVSNEWVQQFENEIDVVFQSIVL